ncbi:MAG TPA: hypothetical protein VMM81_01420 [Acidimicrobiia bacterium]|nr:hypothetical protein [Acidimicrobiia bacterium]
MSSRPLVAMVVAMVLTACGGAGTGATDDIDLRLRSRDFAASAGRALAGTAYERLTPGDLGAAIETVCLSTAPFDAAVLGAVAGIGVADTTPTDDAVAVEVVVAGVVEVCPERVSPEGLVERYQRVVLDIIGDGTVDAIIVRDAGPAICSALDAAGGSVPTGELGVLVAAESLYGIVAPTFADLPAAGLDPERGSVVGVVLAAAVDYLCPHHVAAVMEFLSSLTE